MEDDFSSIFGKIFSNRFVIGNKHVHLPKKKINLLKKRLYGRKN
jgi:hypothetical protein